MKKLGLTLIAMFALGSSTAFAVPYDESTLYTDAPYSGDAPDFDENPDVALDVGTDATSISGSLTDDTQDLFGLSWSDRLFSASTADQFILYLFDGSGSSLSSLASGSSITSYDLGSGSGDYLLGIQYNEIFDASRSYTIELTHEAASNGNGGSTGDGTVPEPAPLALLGLGLVAIALGRRNKRA